VWSIVALCWDKLAKKSVADKVLPGTTACMLTVLDGSRRLYNYCKQPQSEVLNSSNRRENREQANACMSTPGIHTMALFLQASSVHLT